jgi:hypothetical protein
VKKYPDVAAIKQTWKSTLNIYLYEKLRPVGCTCFVLAFYFCISLRCFNAVSPHLVFMHHSSTMSIVGRAIGRSFLLCEHFVLKQFGCGRYFF